MSICQKLSNLSEIVKNYQICQKLTNLSKIQNAISDGCCTVDSLCEEWNWKSPLGIPLCEKLIISLPKSYVELSEAK